MVKSKALKTVSGPHHGTKGLRGTAAEGPEPVDAGRFHRLFPASTYSADPEALRDLAASMDESVLADRGLLGHFPLGFVFLGQFIDHDITFDPVSLFEQAADPEGLVNFRTPNIDLDSLYGAGPDASRHLYDLSTEDQHQIPYRLLLDPGRPDDLPRNSQFAALIGDPRNDENFLISQLHLAFIKFHNAVADWLVVTNERAPDGMPRNKHLFARAHEVVRGHYQWIVLHEFIPLVVGQDLADDVRTNGPLIYPRTTPPQRPFIPMEFSAAAYRFGHTLIANDYSTNRNVQAKALFDLPFFGLQRPDFHEKVDWWRFFDFGASGELPPQRARGFDPFLAPQLLNLPFINPDQDPPASLAHRNMLRAQSPSFRLPTGQETVDHINTALQAGGRDPVAKLSNDEIRDHLVALVDEPDHKTSLRDALNHPGLGGELPLWYYMLAESQIMAGGERLGPTGGRIVAEVLTELILGTPGNPLARGSNWRPVLPARAAGDFKMVDLLRFAGA